LERFLFLCAEFRIRDQALCDFVADAASVGVNRNQQKNVRLRDQESWFRLQAVLRERRGKPDAGSVGHGAGDIFASLTTAASIF
jgi:hypothetical protein